MALKPQKSGKQRKKNVPEIRMLLFGLSMMLIAKNTKLRNEVACNLSRTFSHPSSPISLIIFTFSFLSRTLSRAHIFFSRTYHITLSLTVTTCIYGLPSRPLSSPFLLGGMDVVCAWLLLQAPTRTTPQRRNLPNREFARKMHCQHLAFVWVQGSLLEIE